MRLGVLAPAEIAARRFLPALAEAPKFEFAGVAVPAPDERVPSASRKADGGAVVADRAKAKALVAEHGGQTYKDMRSMIEDPTIDAVYVPLPPSLHAVWGLRAIQAGKHLLMEKPFATSLPETACLLDAARSRGLAVHENYMFAYHAQLAALDAIIASEIGAVRNVTIHFGFPRRPLTDFRYDAALGGGALNDMGGYALAYASRLLGGQATVVAAASSSVDGFGVDVYGSATLVGASGAVAQIAFGMDNAYRCNLDVWGSLGSLTSGRVLTAPAGFVPTATVTTATGAQERDLPADDTFAKSLEVFAACVDDEAARKRRLGEIRSQAELVDQFRRVAGGLR